MAHIHTEPGQHDHTASAYIVRTDFDEPKLMLHRHKKLGIFLQFGGHVELNETPWEAITHELKEEAGYDMDQLTLLQPKDTYVRLTTTKGHPMPIAPNTHEFDETHNHTDQGYLFVTDQEPRHAPDDGESVEFVYLSEADLAQVDPADMHTNTKEICQFIFDEAVKKWDRVDPALFD